VNIQKEMLMGAEYELLHSYGSNPSIQRNEAAKIASGKWLYFLDNDSVVDQLTIQNFLLAEKKYNQAVVIGGPSVLPTPSSEWQKAVQLVFSSDFGIGPLKSRYYSNGNLRVSNEKELILCNMAIKKEIFLKMNGFNENLFPNEENEFLARIKNFGEIIYNPQQIVYREHRDNPLSFLEQMIGYGKGRTRNIMYFGEYVDLVYFLPLGLMIVISISLMAEKLRMIGVVSVGIYSLIVISISILYSISFKSLTFFFKSIMAFIICHTGYAIGLLLGFFDKKTRTREPVKVVKEN
jgi:GT2 family glycosyltransferase